MKRFVLFGLMVVLVCSCQDNAGSDAPAVSQIGSVPESEPAQPAQPAPEPRVPADKRITFSEGEGGRSYGGYPLTTTDPSDFPVIAEEMSKQVSPKVEASKFELLEEYISDYLEGIFNMGFGESDTVFVVKCSLTDRSIYYDGQKVNLYRINQNNKFFIQYLD